MRPGALPISQQFLLDLIAPPVLAIVWRFKAIGWARAVQGSKFSARTRDRQWMEFWAVLILGYLVMFGVTIYGWLT
jgi:hypothetical protein